MTCHNVICAFKRVFGICSLKTSFLIFVSYYLRAVVAVCLFSRYVAIKLDLLSNLANFYTNI